MHDPILNIQLLGLLAVLYNASSMWDHSLQRWPNIKPALD